MILPVSLTSTVVLTPVVPGVTYSTVYICYGCHSKCSSTYMMDESMVITGLCTNESPAAKILICIMYY